MPLFRLNRFIPLLLLALACTGEAQTPAAAPVVADEGGSSQSNAATWREIEPYLNDAPEDERILVLYEAFKSRVHIPAAAVDKLLRDASPQVRQSMGNYPFLSDKQIRTIVNQRDVRTIGELLANRDIVLAPGIVDALVNATLVPTHRAMATSDRLTLTQDNVRRLASSRDLLTRFFVAQRYGAGSPIEIMLALLDDGNESDIALAINHLHVVPKEIVNRILARSDMAVRRYLTMQGRFIPTDRQVQAILQDPDPEVRIGILRRRDVVLTPEQINAGVSDRREELAFWYRNRNEFHPTEAQIEDGLTSPSFLTRRHFALRKEIVPNVVQVERGLTDPDETVRRAFAQRENVKLTQDQLDRCMVDPNFSVRYACVQRPDYSLSQARFELLLLDKNPNMLAVFADAGRASHVDVSPFVWRTLKSAPAATRIALADNRRVALDEAQLLAGLSAAEEDVRVAFARRQRAGARH